jgi:hypothetical protein
MGNRIAESGANLFDTFISYSHEDEEIAQFIFGFLEKLPGVKPFRDARSILPGAEWAIELQNAIEHCGTFLVLIPRTRSEWVRKECQIAIRQRSRGSQPRIIPIIIHENINELTYYELGFYQVIQWHSYQPITMLSRDVATFFPSPTPDTKPRGLLGTLLTVFLRIFTKM